MKTIMVRGTRITRRIFFLILLGLLTCVTAQDDLEESFSWSFGSEADINDRHPCVVGGILVFHKQSIQLDPCTQCTCKNGTTICNIESCPSMDRCEALEVTYTLELCCPLCPYKMVVVDTMNRYDDTFTFSEEESKLIRFRLNIAVDKKLSSREVRGENLWKLSAWISPNNDGSGEKYYLTNDVFTREDAAKKYFKPSYPPWVWSRLIYLVSFKGGTCADYKYFCVRFGRGENPIPFYDIYFSFHAFDNEEERLIDCVALGPCKKRIAPCIEGNIVSKDKCTTCLCLNGIFQCTEERCVTSNCEEGKEVEEECCLVYPYKLHVEETEVTSISDSTFSIGMPELLNITFDLTLKIKERMSSRFIRGDNLWKLTIWISSHRNGAKYQMIDNLFSDEASSKSYEKSIGNSSYMTWENLIYEIDLSVGECNHFKLFCVRFSREAEAAPMYEVDFSITSDNPEHLVDCQDLGECKEDITQLENGLIDVNTLVVIICFSTILILLLSFAIVLLMKRQRRQHVKERKFSDHQLGDARQVDPLLQANEINLSHVRLEQEVGKGEFGIVFRGVVTGLAGQPDPMTVAVKTIKDDERKMKEDFLDEMKLLASLGEHRNILSLVACCSRRDPMYIITDFMKYGDLLGFLRKCREDDSPTIDPIYSFGEKEQIIVSREIANGMAFLESKRICHGDLAARNVLVGEGLKIKISDFGMSDDIYSRGYKRWEEAGKKIPVKWCSPETIFSGICSSKSDVWSFGVVMHEIFSLGGTPYPGMALNFFVSKLKDGYRMEKADNCPGDVYGTMVKCWRVIPQNRPEFSSIFEELGDLLNKRCDYCEFSTEEDLLGTTGSQSQGTTSGIGEMLHPIEEDEGEADVMELLKIVKGSKKEPSQASTEDTINEIV